MDTSIREMYRDNKILKFSDKLIRRENQHFIHLTYYIFYDSFFNHIFIYSIMT